MMNISIDTLTIVILGLSTYRLTKLLFNEAGPFDIFGKLRLIVGVAYDEHSNRIAKNPVAEIFNCPHCLGVWVGFAIWGSYYLWTPLLFWLYIPLALSAISSLLFLRFGHG